ncbi:malate:quinone oxidoreductase, partial [Staphylococcus capitis]|uniref:malate:quinone oxidoreductase n=1 Tax=Staphylococcus capitis TaxID=29388 RepID=UPI0037095869
MHPLPHITFLRPKNNLKFLKHPYQAIKNFPIFHNIQCTEHFQQIKKCIPLIIQPPQNNPPLMPPTKIHQPTHLNYPPLTPKIPKNLHHSSNLQLQ